MSGLPAPHPEPAPAEEGLSLYLIHPGDILNGMYGAAGPTPSDALDAWVDDKGLSGYTFVCARTRHDPFQHWEVIVRSGEVEHMINVVPAAALEGGL